MHIENCLACRVNRGELVPPGGIIHREADWVVDHVIGSGPWEPIPLKGFLIVCPTAHVENIHELSPWKMVGFGLLLRDVTRAVQLTLKPERVYVCSFGESVRHVHWYVIPRYAGMPENAFDVLTGIFQKHRWICSPEEAANAAQRIKTKLKRLIMVRKGEACCNPFDGGL